MTFYELYERLHPQLAVKVDFRTKAGRRFKRELQQACDHITAAHGEWITIALNPPSPGARREDE